MAYTAPIDSADPLSSEKAKLGASRIRELALALRERLASIFTDPDADPLVLKPNTVNTAAIQDNAVTIDKIADAAVGASQLADAAVTASKIPDSTIPLAKFDNIAKATLAQKTDYNYIFAVGAMLPVGASTIVVDASPHAGDRFAHWLASPLGDFTTDPVALGTTLQPFSDSTKLGVVIRNHTGAPLAATGYILTVTVVDHLP